MKTRDIKLKISLSDDDHPQKIEWEATDAGFEGSKACEAMMLHLWDQEEHNSMHIDLWTPKMTVNEMHIHIFNDLMYLSDLCQRATRNSELSHMIKDLAGQYMQKMQAQQKT